MNFSQKNLLNYKIIKQKPHNQIYKVIESLYVLMLIEYIENKENLHYKGGGVKEYICKILK